MKNSILAAVWLLFAVLACPASAEEKTSLSVFVSIPPQEWLAARVGGPLVTTRVLVASGQSPHNFELGPKQLVALGKADLYFSVGMEFEKRLLGKIGRSAGALKFVASDRGVSRIAMVDHKHDVNRETPDHDEYSSSGKDPHIWLSAPNLKIMARNMAEAMISADPAHRDNYEKNCRQTITDLEALHAKIEEMLIPFKGSSFFVFHPAFGYFARDYCLHQEAVEVEGKSPSPRQIARLIELARNDGVKTIFIQPQFDEESAAAIADAIDGEVVPLDPLALDVGANLMKMAEKIVNSFNR